MLISIVKKFFRPNNEKQFIYWVETKDHSEDWFVGAKNSRSARAFFEGYEGFNPFDASAKKLCPIPYKCNQQRPFYAQLDLLRKCGFHIISRGPARVVRRNGKIYREGIVPHWAYFDSSDRNGAGVYIIHACGTQKFKIGIANNFRTRFKSLQTSSPEELEPFYFYSTVKYRTLEKFLHNTFKNKCIGREWFEFDDDDLENIHGLVLDFKKNNSEK